MANKIKLTKESIKTELKQYKDDPYKCLFEYIWNAFDANATEVELNYNTPENNFGYIQDSLEIKDNGDGWKFKTDPNTENFLSSTKADRKSKQRTLPKGEFGRGRYTFIWIAQSIDIYSNYEKLSLHHTTDYELATQEDNIHGTKIIFNKIDSSLEEVLFNKELLEENILQEFCWFLKQNPDFKITINGGKVNPDKNIKELVKCNIDDFSEYIQEKIQDELAITIILWDKKPSEWSNFYFLNNEGIELSKNSTSLNKKGDNFWHSVYIYSDLQFYEIFEDKDSLAQELDFFNIKTLKKTLIIEIKEKLINLRKPYLIERSNNLIPSLKNENILPDLNIFGIYDSGSYADLLKTIYVISPSLFENKGKNEKKFFCSTLAGLLSTQDNNLIQLIFEQLQELTESEKKDLKDILERTTLQNVVRTVKEIDHRLEVIDKLKILISEHEIETLEVKHLQKILNENFWIFGEQFRLFSTTEGALKRVILKYAKEILLIEDPVLDTQPLGEVDLFLTIQEEYSGIQKNIIIEIKRASKSLKKEVEYRQIEKYRKNILSQSLCNGENQYWEFYLIGKDYDDDIRNEIENAKNHGERQRGLTYSIDNGRVKTYVRKWSDILEVEWGVKMKYLKDKIRISASGNSKNSPDEIVGNLTENLD